MRFLLVLLSLLAVTHATINAGEKLSGWLSWRGPHQNGSSDEKGLPEKWGKPLWEIDCAGQSSPVIANGKLYVISYHGTGPDLQEGLFCFDAETGKNLWSHSYNDYISDIIYTRYASSSPSIDAETGNVYMMGTQGLLAGFSADGKELWHHWMMEEYGRLTFPNGRTQSPIVDGNIVIVGAMTANWGAHGPGGHRFYAFNKHTGDLVWASWPGERPKDSSFSTPHMGWYNNQRVFWSGGGDGCVYCVNAGTGDPIWRYKTSHAGLNTSVVSYKDTVIAVHGGENLDSAIIGRMVAIRPTELKPGADGKGTLFDKSSEAWRVDVAGTSTSPTLAGNRVYQVTDMPAKLFCVDADTGKVLWNQLLGLEERQSSPVFGDGKIYVATQEGECYIIKPTDAAAQVLDKIKLEGADSGTGICQGTPGIYRGRIYIQTTKKLYCFGPKEAGAAPVNPPEQKAKAGALTRFIVTPAEMLLKPGEKKELQLTGVDAQGNWLSEKFDSKQAKWEGYIPPTAKVKSSIKGGVKDGLFVAEDEKIPSAGALKAELSGASGITRGRVLPDLPMSEDFEKYVLQERETEPKDMFAYPPLPWIGARLKWEVRAKDGGKVLAKNVDDIFFQRAFTFMGTPDMSNYTAQIDLMSDGVTRKVGGKDKIQKMSEVGIIHQRYVIFLKGNKQELEINSNMERLQFSVPFAWLPGTWYTLKTRVDVDAATGVGTIRGKAWKKGDPEPEKWTIEFQHKTAHKAGAPGIFGFTPQALPVYVDNVKISKN